MNSSSDILKTPLREALSQSAAQHVLAELLPTQMGVGMRAGSQIKVVMARLLFEAGYFTSLQDMLNAFNAIFRQVVLDATKEMWPEATLLINKVYGPKAPCIYLYDDAEGVKHAACMLSEEGSRMGCILGGTIFNIAVHVCIYVSMNSRQPARFVKSLSWRT